MTDKNTFRAGATLRTLLLLLTAPLWGPPILLLGWLRESADRNFDIEWAKDECPEYYRQIKKHRENQQ